MVGRKFKFHNGEKGSALAIRIKSGARTQKFKKVLRDGTVIVQLRATPGNLNQELLRFLSNELGVDKENLQIIAGEKGKKKLVSILQMKPEEIQKAIQEQIG
jgi:uncharacterized protein YggU (UPF0235/DUF167 family)